MRKLGRQLISQMRRTLLSGHATEDGETAVTIVAGGETSPDSNGSSWTRTCDWLRCHFSYDRQTTRSTAISVMIHLVAMLMIYEWRFPERTAGVLPQLQHALAEPQEPLDAEFELAEAADDPAETVWSTAALAIAPNVADDVPELSEEMPLVDESDADIRLTRLEPLAAIELDDVRTQLGSIGSEVVAVSGAVDQIAHEIVMNLEESDVLVVWLMDASISLKDDRQQIADRLERVYDEISQVTAEGTLDPDALSGAVLSFGRDTTELVAPTGDGNEIVEAIRDKVPIDESGVENVFTAVVTAANKYRVLRTRGKRKLMFVIWTDESGDDVAALEHATDVCQRLGISVFTVGPSSMFGREMGTQAYKHPGDGQIYNLPVKRGPDTARQEQVELPFWFGQGQPRLRAGVGPFALVRLAYQTDGAYFINDAERDRSPFEPAVMRRYLPTYASPQEYNRQVAASPLRRAVLQAVDVTRQRELKGTPRLEFAPTGDNFQDELREAQESVAYNLHVVELALQAVSDASLEEQYQAEVSPRWRAWYDLTMGRLLAMYVRSMEYNWACAVMKGKGADFVNTKSNRWKFEPDEQLNYGTLTQRRAEETKKYLERCVAENQGTPWAVIASRELQYPFGFRVEETYVPPPPPRTATAGNNRPPAGLSEEQLRMLSREPQVNLPNL